MHLCHFHMSPVQLSLQGLYSNTLVVLVLDIKSVRFTDVVLYQVFYWISVKVVKLHFR